MSEGDPSHEFESKPNIFYLTEGFRISRGDPSRQESYICDQRARGNTRFTDWFDYVKQVGWDALTPDEQQYFIKQFSPVKGHTRASGQQESLAAEFRRDPRGKFNEEMDNINPYRDDWGFVDENGRPRYATTKDAIKAMEAKIKEMRREK